MVTPGTQPTLRLIRERDVEDIRSAARDAFSVGRVLVLRPSVPALQMLLTAYGFEIESMYDWKGRLAGRPLLPGLEGYAKGKRVTLRCRSREAAIAAGWEPVPSLLAAAGPAPGTRDPHGTPAQPTRGWRERVNRTLARATGYELRRASTGR